MGRVPGLVTRIPSNRRSGELGPGPRRWPGRAAAEATHLPPSASPEAGQPQRVEPLRRVLAVPRAALGVEGVKFPQTPHGPVRPFATFLKSGHTPQALG